MYQIDTGFEADAEFLKKLFRNYYDRLVYYAFQIVRDREVAKDLVQESFLSYWSYRERVSFQEKYVKNFLFVTVKNAAFKWLKKQSIAQNFVRTRPQEKIEEPCALSVIVRAEIFQELNEVINALPEGCRTVTWMSYIEGKSNQEVADHLDISVNTVKTQKQRAIRYFRARLLDI